MCVRCSKSPPPQRSVCGWFYKAAPTPRFLPTCTWKGQTPSCSPLPSASWIPRGFQERSLETRPELVDLTQTALYMGECGIRIWGTSLYLHDFSRTAQEGIAPRRFLTFLDFTFWWVGVCFLWGVLIEGDNHWNRSFGPRNCCHLHSLKGSCSILWWTTSLPDLF